MLRIRTLRRKLLQGYVYASRLLLSLSQGSWHGCRMWLMGIEPDAASGAGQVEADTHAWSVGPPVSVRSGLSASAKAGCNIEFRGW